MRTLAAFFLFLMPTAALAVTPPNCTRQNFLHSPHEATCIGAVQRILGTRDHLCFTDHQGTTCKGHSNEIQTEVVMETTSEVYLLTQSCRSCLDVLGCNKETGKAYVIQKSHGLSTDELEQILADETDGEVPACEL